MYESQKIHHINEINKLRQELQKLLNERIVPEQGKQPERHIELYNQLQIVRKELEYYKQRCKELQTRYTIPKVKIIVTI